MAVKQKKLPTSTILIAIVAIACGLLFVMNPAGDKDDDVDGEVKSSTGFVECAADVGIDFQMGFLPGEQGPTFKINLYDHGCGVAVGD